MRAPHRLLGLAILVLNIASVAGAQSYTITDLGPNYAFGLSQSGDVSGYTQTGQAYVWTRTLGLVDLGTLGGLYSFGEGVNAGGHVVGGSTLGTVEHAFISRPGSTLEDLGTLPGNSCSFAYGINDAGEVVGYSFNGTGSTHAFIWSQLTGMQDLGTLTNATTSIAYAINLTGNAVGQSPWAASNSHAVLWSPDRVIHDLGTLPGGTGSGATGINRTGSVVGDSDSGTHLGISHAVLWSGAKIRDLGALPGAIGSVATAINDAGHIVGGSYLNGMYHATIWTASNGIQDLNALIPPNSGWFLEYATGINNRGQVAGYGQLNGQTEAFLLTPTTSK